MSDSTNSDTSYTGSIMVGVVKGISKRNRMDYDLNAQRMTDVISLEITDDRDEVEIVKLAMPATFGDVPIKKGEIWAIAVRSYWSFKSSQMRIDVRKDLRPFLWNQDAA